MECCDAAPDTAFSTITGGDVCICVRRGAVLLDTDTNICDIAYGGDVSLICDVPKSVDGDQLDVRGTPLTISNLTVSKRVTSAPGGPPRAAGAVVGELIPGSASLKSISGSPISIALEHDEGGARDGNVRPPTRDPSIVAGARSEGNTGNSTNAPPTTVAPKPLVEEVGSGSRIRSRRR